MWIVPILLSFFAISASASTNHEIFASINPASHSISVIDKITLKENKCNKALIVTLHSDLRPKIVSPVGASFEFIESEMADELHKLKIERYKLTLPCNSQSVTLEYGGSIFHPVTDPDDPYSRGTADSPGLISEEGVVLASGTYWYPKFENIEDQFVSFSLQVEAPKDWSVVAQGERLLPNMWQEQLPQQDIYLIAAKFTEYEKILPSGLKVQAFLRTKDDALATRYLDVTSGYIERYNSLIGAFPYAKFALVENFWDTGFGMPSFTLLGSNIIRLPFIITTSYPHEILHDWWGNSVYVDYNRGNWCEGITAYMADHLMSELSGAGATYRRDTLQKFTDYVTPKNDFPLNKFLERRDAASEAIGYGKTSMFFHMLRQRVGDENFRAAFSHFYTENKFKEVSFSEIRESFEKVSGTNLVSEFSQWVDRLGAPSLKITEVSTTPTPSGFKFHAKIEQIQTEDVFDINLPIAISLEGSENAFQKNFKMSRRTLSIDLNFPTRPIWLQVDPEFDTFRRLSKDEVPPVLTMALGAQKTLLVLPSLASSQTISNWKNFIELMKPALPKGSEIEVALDSNLAQLPNDRAIWVLGSENLLTKKFSSHVDDLGVKIDQEAIEIGGVKTPFKDHSFTLLGRDKKSKQVWAFIATDSDPSFATLAAKLIHYGKYSFLGFEGEKVTNMMKGIWKLQNSSMSVPVLQADGAEVDQKIGKLAKRSALVNQ